MRLFLSSDVTGRGGNMDWAAGHNSVTGSGGETAQMRSEY